MNSVVKQRIADIQRGNLPAGYRKTKCGIIPDTWSCCQPKEIFSGKSIKNNDSELPVLSVTQENGVMLRSEMDKDISYNEDSVSSYKRVDIGDFVISLRSFEGGIEYSQCQGVVSPAYTIFSHSEDVDGNYYKYYFKTDFFINKLNTAVYGIRDGKQIGFQDFSNLFIHRPPLEEQRRIAEILGCCDRVIALKKELIAEKKKQKKALMQKLLNPDSGFSGEWKEFVLNELGETYSGLAGKTAKDFECGNSFFVPYLNIFENTIVDVNKLEQVDIKPHENQNLVRYGDIFFTTSSETPEEVGMSSVFLADVNDTYLNSFCFGFRLYDFKKLLPFFAAYYLRSDYMRTILNNLAQGATRFNISKTLLMKSKIKIPSSTVEQQAIADILSAADKEIDLLEQELAQQEQKKKSLMQLLLTGIVRG